MTDDEWNPTGLTTSQSFRAYVARLRETSTFDAPDATECARETHNHGRPAGTRSHDFRNMTSDTLTVEESNTDNNQQTGLPPAHRDMTRRTMMKGSVASVAALTAMGAAGTAAASEVLNFDSEYVPNPSAPMYATISESSPTMGVLEYYDDDGEVASLADTGARVAARPEDAEDEPHNPVTVSADRFALSTYHAYPRGETYEDEDGEEQDLSALDAQHWNDATGITTDDTTTPAGETALNVSGADAVSTFSDSELTSGIDRTYLQVGFTVNSIDEGAAVHIRVTDGADQSREVSIEEGGDTSVVDVIGDGSETAAIRQVELGELAGDLDEIQEVELEIAGGNADVDLFAFNAERSSRWDFGVREYLDVDEEEDEEELDEETVYEPTGWYSVIEYDALPDMVRDATIYDLQVDTEVRASDLADDNVDHAFSDADRYSEDHRAEKVFNFPFPEAHDLDLDLGPLEAEQMHPSGRYLRVEVETGEHDPYSVEDADSDDGDMDGNDITGRFDGDIGSDVTITEGTVQGRTTSVYYNVLVTDAERDDMTAADEAGAPATSGREGRGIAGYVLSAPGMIITGILGFLGLSRLGIFSRGGN